MYGSFAPSTASVIGTALMFGAAAFLTGGLVGFLFGVPKGAGGDATVGTQLEQISTWLATIVVGLTLSQLGRIPGALGKLADIMKPALGNQASSGEFGVAVVVFYAVLGFLFLYLWTRTLLVNEFAVQQPAARAQAVGVHTAPVLASIESAPLTYVAGSQPLPVTSTLTVSSPDATTLTGATVSISSGLVAAGDSLRFTSENGISGSYNAGTGILALTGTAALADYQAALRSVTYSDSNSSVTPGARTISFQVNDGSSKNNVSNVLSRTASIQA